MSTSTWFHDVFGFPESQNYDEVRISFRVEESEDDDSVILHTVPPGDDVKVESRSFFVGKFETPSLAELRSKMKDTTAAVCTTDASDLQPKTETSRLSFQHITGGAGILHRDPKNHGAVFQAASQFNCLEMVSPGVKPEDGITRYASDRTQGPECAMACPAGTLYRNYFVNGTGQGKGDQLDLLKDVGDLIGNMVQNEADGSWHPVYWKMRNGYALAATSSSIQSLRMKFEHGDFDVEAARSRLRIGVHWETEVDHRGGPETPAHTVTQIYCSALPIAYDYTASARDWEPFAQLVLDGAYEATLAAAAVLSRQREGERVRVFLTKLGGGVFRNKEQWISRAINRAITMFRNEPLDISLVHFGWIERYYLQAISPIHYDGVSQMETTRAKSRKEAREQVESRARKLDA